MTWPDVPKGPLHPPEVNPRLDGFKPADEQIREDFWLAIGINQDMLMPLAEHHTPDLSDSYYVLHDRSATYGHPGDPQILALHLRRDLGAETFDFECTGFPLAAMAQSWLIHRGCPAELIGLDPALGTAPADEATRALETRLMADGDHYALGYSYTRDDPNDMVTVAALRALDEQSPSPSAFRVLVKEVDLDAWTHTTREGGFATVEEALQWCDDRLSGKAGPLPPVKPTAPLSLPVSPPNTTVRPPGRSR
ncbi:hypothetical protein ACIOHE_23910 [Streptomyces sp. NPDC087851]|uniref:hypothetical protein n=1 Tax=Streptomyces sp. NPDC087851 TaxID=3365810 RepID=UPI0037FE9FCD